MVIVHPSPAMFARAAADAADGAAHEPVIVIVFPAAHTRSSSKSMKS